MVGRVAIGSLMFLVLAHCKKCSSACTEYEAYKVTNSNPPAHASRFTYLLALRDRGYLRAADCTLDRSASHCCCLRKRARVGVAASHKECTSTNAGQLSPLRTIVSESEQPHCELSTCCGLPQQGGETDRAARLDENVNVRNRILNQNLEATDAWTAITSI